LAAAGVAALMADVCLFRAALSRRISRQSARTRRLNVISAAIERPVQSDNTHIRARIRQRDVTCFGAAGTNKRNDYVLRNC